MTDYPKRLMTVGDRARFRSKFVESSEAECWEWLAGRSSNGYGAFHLGGSNKGAHRVAYVIFHNLEDWPSQHILHLCDNPGCVNPHHLQEGTQSENMRQMWERGRASAENFVPPGLKGEEKSQAKLTNAEVLEIRKRYAEGGCTQAVLANEYGVSESLICYVINRKRWAHV